MFKSDVSRHCEAPTAKLLRFARKDVVGAEAKKPSRLRRDGIYKLYEYLIWFCYHHPDQTELRNAVCLIMG
jgi:hypothetical protein